MTSKAALRTWYLTIIAAASVAAAIVLSTSSPLELAESDLFSLGVLVLLTAAGIAFPVEVAPKVKMGVGITAIFAALLLFGTAAALLVTVMGMLLAYVIRPGHNSMLARAFNVAVLSLAGILAGAAGGAVAGRSLIVDLNDGREIAAIITAGVVLVAVNSILVAVAADLALGQPLLRYYLLDQRDKLPQNVALLLLGALAALVGTGRPWAIALVAIPMAIVALSLHQTAQIRRQTREAIEQLADIVDLRDRYTAEHSRRVAGYAAELCRELGLSRAETDVIVRAARVHDIGKLGMSSAILSEARPLTPEEVAEIQRHPAIGAEIVARFADFRAGASIVLHHHERWDGTGYPGKLAGEKIPYGARIVAVCDTFDAMTTDRPYRLALPVSTALAEIARCAGTQFDPQIAAAFLRLHGYAPPQPARDLQTQLG
ncbi:MAG: HD-GYP domain-containing protein [Chloroflexota bacterium]|nr:HD-GYP domain-containing protein [Dehalococcoidia bacterium]MDW8253744.1 HD-GYP domain-containing protein [Chloroflexota bacterium]